MVETSYNNNIEISYHKKYYKGERSEEVKDIIERMPVRFGLWISLIVLFMFLLLFIFGWLVRYPDVVRGGVTISTPIASVKLVANMSGKLKLGGRESLCTVKSGEVIASMESATSYDTLETIKHILANYNPGETSGTAILGELPAKVALGELTPKYYSFLSSLRQLADFNNNRLYDKQIEGLKKFYYYQTKEVANSIERISMYKSSLEYSDKFFKRDSFLFAVRVAAEAEYDRAKVDYLSNKVNMSNAYSSLVEAEKQSQQTLSKISEINIQRDEKGNELQLALLASYNDLMNNITLWEQRYLFRAPFDGKVQFLKFWTDNQFVQSGEPIFTILPNAAVPYGQVVLPAPGAGKVKNGQEVIVKLDDYPYNEYGSISGRVCSISLTTSTEKDSQVNIEAYLITVKFPRGLTTNYNRPLLFRHEARGTAEIITNDRRLFERLFDNLKYILNK